MIFNINNKSVIFVHIPKTAGTSILSALLNDPALKIKGHKIAKDYAYEAWLSSFSFSVVRNPYDRFVSHWLYHTTNYNGYKFSRLGIDIQNKSLEEYFYITTQVVSRYKYNWLSMTKFLYHPSDKPLDFLLRFENLDQDWTELCDILDIPKTLSLPQLNTTPHDHYKKYYNATTKELITNYYYQDFIAYGYDIE